MKLLKKLIDLLVFCSLNYIIEGKIRNFKHEIQPIKVIP